MPNDLIWNIYANYNEILGDLENTTGKLLTLTHTLWWDATYIFVKPEESHIYREKLNSEAFAVVWNLSEKMFTITNQDGEEKIGAFHVIHGKPLFWTAE